MIFDVEPGVISVLRGRLNLLNRIYFSNEWTPSIDAMCVSFSSLAEKNVGWLYELNAIFVEAGVDAPVDVFETGMADVTVLNASMYEARLERPHQHATSLFFSKLLLPDGLPKSLLSALFDLPLIEAKGLLLLMSGAGRWVLFRDQFLSCPKCHATPFRSLHLLECPSFWLHESVYVFTERVMFENRMDLLIEKLVELFEFWREVRNFAL